MGASCTESKDQKTLKPKGALKMQSQEDNEERSLKRGNKEKEDFQKGKGKEE
jgi:hypothetical protein